MAKKLGKGLNEDTHFIKRGKFEMETAKMYIVFALVLFHIIPLIFVFLGEAGEQTLMTMFLYTLNIVFISCICAFYGIRVGFNFKFPLVMLVIGLSSYICYYSSGNMFADANHYVAAGVIITIVYALFSIVATAVGGWLKKFF